MKQLPPSFSPSPNDVRIDGGHHGDCAGVCCLFTDMEGRNFRALKDIIGMLHRKDCSSFLCG